MSTSPTSNINNAPNTGSFWQDATNNILDLFDKGRQVYEAATGRTIAGDKITTETVKPPVTVVESPKILGLTQNQALIVAGALTVILVVSISRRG
jgi:hypothetical protein